GLGTRNQSKNYAKYLSLKPLVLCVLCSSVVSLFYGLRVSPTISFFPITNHQSPITHDCLLTLTMYILTTIY
ncbi:hypothetical protein, partial [Sphaerospermopsis reniformis]|uniref:hypothetical protein n=1 Tax=Sphaerospermopsis reniformis TaxID=531300 RepID=UPI001F1DE12E